MDHLIIFSSILAIEILAIVFFYVRHVRSRLRKKIPILYMDRRSDHSIFIPKKDLETFIEIKTGDEVILEEPYQTLVESGLLFKLGEETEETLKRGLRKNDIFVALEVNESMPPEIGDLIITFDNALSGALETVLESYTGYDAVKDYKFKTKTGYYSSESVLGPIIIKALR